MKLVDKGMSQNAQDVTSGNRTSDYYIYLSNTLAMVQDTLRWPGQRSEDFTLRLLGDFQSV